MKRMSSAEPTPARLAEALMDIVATRGLDRASVREVAAAAGVSIGAVQHHFAAKDDLLAFVFRHVVERTTQRIAAISLGRSVRRNFACVLRELLPLDAARRREARVYVAFAARAALVPALAAIQRETQARLREGFTEALRRAQSRGCGRLAPALDAALLLAVADGLTFDAVSEPDHFSPRKLERLLDLYLDRLLSRADSRSPAKATPRSQPA